MSDPNYRPVDLDVAKRLQTLQFGCQVALSVVAGAAKLRVRNQNIDDVADVE